MATEGGGKIKSKRNQLPSKPYEKKPSLLGKIKSSVKDLLIPSWLRTPLNSSNTSAAQDQQVTQPQLVQSISNDLVASQHSNAQVVGGSRLSATEQPIRLDLNRASGSSPHGQMSSNYEEPCLENSSGPPPNVNIANLSQFGRNWLDKNESIGYNKSSSSSAVHRRKADDPVRMRMSDSYLEETDQDEPIKVRPIMVSTGTPSRGIEASAAKRQKLWNPQEVRHGKPFVAPVTDRPAFNSLLFGTPTKNDSSIFGGNFHESSFYSGKTRFGGAAAERRSLNTSLPYQSSLPLRKQVKATNLNSSFNATTSATAQRILETLDKMSTPLGDAKKMTQVDKSNDSVLSFTPSSYRRSSILGLGKPASRPLQIPQVGPPKYIHQSISQAVIAKNRSKQSGSHDLGSTAENSLPISMEPSVSREKSGHIENVPQLSTDTGKIKTKKFTQHIKSKAAEEEVEVPTLRTDFTLPISCINPASLTSTFASSVAATKSFDNSLPLKFTFSTPIEEKSRSGNSPVLTNIEKGFIFSSPIKASSQKINGAGAEEGSKSSPEPAVGASSGVAGTFSHSLSPWEPVKPKPKVASPDIGGTSSSFKTFKWNDLDKNDSSAASDVASCGFTLAPAESLKTGSVMDLLGKDDFMTKFKKPAGTWECATCMVANKPDASKCVACDASKPGVKPKQPEQISKTDDLMAKFKKAPGSWECDSCMLSNKPEAVKCVACDSAKPGSKPLPGNTNSSANSLSELFKKPPGNWECDTCMVQNSATALRCIACDSSKPGLQAAGIVSKPASNTTSSAVTISPAGGFVFNLPPTTTTTEGSGGFKFGNANTSISTISPSPATGFTFGKTLANKDTIATTTDSQNPVSSAPNTGGFKFEALNSGIGSGSTGVPTGGFVFGNTSSKTQSINGPGSITSVGFQFGASNKLQNKTDVVLTTVTDSSSPLSNGSSVANEPKSNMASQSAGFQFNSSANSALSSSEPATFTKFASNDNATKPLQPSFGSFLSSEGQSTTTTLPSAQKSTNVLFQFGQTNSSLASTSVGLGMNKIDNKPTVNGLFGGFDSAPVKGITQGIGTNDPSSAKKTVQFGSFSNDQSTNGLFTFGSTPQKAAPISTAPSPVAAGLGLFGSNSVMGGQTQGASFQFAAGPTPSVPAVNFAFKSGSDMSKPVLEHSTQPQNKVIPSFSLTPNFNFGSTVQPANTPFQFGAKPVSSDNTSATTGFSFGASNAAPNVPMTANFNIGSGDPTRKIRKAVRKIKK